ncbi:uncharacterized protein LTR77_000290 [Saxophila tyrrhenica]|uniref:Uncharacterized protein n=1 Tax=Saxophila tyrrhenica TaxID=1690608 RepID=A0AAV9PS14_9PEZI|nr:hypothetical protein LTR77_000290 [Saxophila tyrrhenica]
MVFLHRAGGNQETDKNVVLAGDGHSEAEQTNEALTLEELTLVHPPSVLASVDELIDEFVRSMLETKTAAKVKAGIATGLFLVIATMDVLVIHGFVLLMGSAVLAYSSIKGAKDIRTLTKRVTGPSETDKPDKGGLQLSFSASPRLAVFEKYLAAECFERSPYMFPDVGDAPEESEVLEAMGWSPSSQGDTEARLEDRRWENFRAMEDLYTEVWKATRAWTRWVNLCKRHPKLAVRK